MTTPDSHSQLDSLVRCTPDTLLAVDAEGRVAQYVPASDRFLGYDPEALVGDSAVEYVHPADRDAVLDAVRALSAGDTAMVRFRVRTAAGDWVSVEASITTPADGDVAAYVVSVREDADALDANDTGDALDANDTGDASDASGSRSSEREVGVDALHELYEIASATELSFETKRSRLLELGRRRLGLPYAFVSRITEDTQTIVASAGDHELLQPGESCPIEESYCRKTIHADGLLALFDAGEEGFLGDPAYDRFGLGSYIGGKLVVDGDLYGTLCFAGPTPRQYEFSDSERTFVELASRWLSYELTQRQYQAELERQNDRLERFASVVSHDLRNPLSIVEGRLDTARRDHDSDDLRIAADALDRAFDLIDEVLEFARMGEEVTATEPVSLATVATDAWEMVDSEGVSLVVEDDSIRVAADPDRLQRLLENLFRNSVEHGSTGSRTQSDDSVDHGGEELTTVRVGRLPDGFYVADDGRGIAAEDREAVFEGGYTTDRQGTGFGLSIVKQIAEAHGWSVSLTESADGGARFEFLGTDPAAI